MTGGAAAPAGRVALVTGAARGLGRAIAERLFAAGHRVALGDLDAAGAAAAAAELDPAGERATGLFLDVRRKDCFEAARDDLAARWGGPHILVNNAGRSQVEELMAISPESFSEVVATNLEGAFLGCQVFGAHFADLGFGRIVNLASLAGQNGGTATGAHYAAAKGGVLTLTKVFARELAGRGVTVNAVSPGPLDLPVVRESVPADRLAAVVAGIPVGTLGSPAFIADTVALLTADHAASVTGACWDANGGLYMR
ncbi:SDR family NAD(P)-dependent oxidoreductase [Streptomyces sp. NPDC047117]|uniref:SDR family NAD(P)-dependent oxidoreductase n=1 Tax=Streptomyces sp. NPDC047117 TaxID=3155379 RepID=UPI0033EC0123